MLLIQIPRSSRCISYYDHVNYPTHIVDGRCIVLSNVILRSALNFMNTFTLKFLRFSGRFLYVLCNWISIAPKCFFKIGRSNLIVLNSTSYKWWSKKYHEDVCMDGCFVCSQKKIRQRYLAKVRTDYDYENYFGCVFT